MPNLTQAQMSQLQHYSTAGDRYNYWNSLAQWGAKEVRGQGSAGQVLQCNISPWLPGNFYKNEIF